MYGDEECGKQPKPLVINKPAEVETERYYEGAEDECDYPCRELEVAEHMVDEAHQKGMDGGPAYVYAFPKVAFGKGLCEGEVRKAVDREGHGV